MAHMRPRSFLLGGDQAGVTEVRYAQGTTPPPKTLFCGWVRSGWNMLAISCKELLNVTARFVSCALGGTRIYDSPLYGPEARPSHPIRPHLT
jgi:hypothetical protein